MSRSQRRVGRWLTGSQPALANPNIRRYLLGQQVSQVGLWMQNTAELWLVLEITQSGIALGLHSVLRFGPLLIFGIHGGLLSDRFDRLRLLTVTQSLHALGTLLVVVAAVLPDPSVELVYMAAVFKGFVNAVDNPLRRTFMRDLATDAQMQSAVALNAVMVNATGVVGPAIAGVVIATVGVVWCFVLNTLSYGGVILALRTIDRSRLRASTPATDGRGQIRAGLRYASRDPETRLWLIVATAVGIFAWNYNIVIPVYATETMGGGAATYGYLLSTIAAGSLVGAIASARGKRAGRRHIAAAMAVVASSLGATALAPTLVVAYVALFLLGASGISVLIAAQTGLQLRSPEGLAGRVMALYSIGVTGSRPIGGALGGGLIDVSGPRLAFGFGAIAIAATTVWMAVGLRRR